MWSFEIYRKFDTSSGKSSLTHSTGSVQVLERQTVHVSDDSGRIAMLEKRIIGTDDSKEALTRYVYSNHLQSASLELDEYAAIVSYEEIELARFANTQKINKTFRWQYHPYGTTAFQAKSATINAVAKRYRYTGKERDEESGLYYHGARYYIPWLCRWTAIDPMESKYAGMSPYNYSFNNPIMWNDLSGADPDGGWYAGADKMAKHDIRLTKPEKMKTLGLQGSYIGSTVWAHDQDGNWAYGDENGEWTFYGEAERVTVTGVHPRRGLMGDMGYNIRQASLMGLNYNEDLHKRLNAIDNTLKGFFVIGSIPFLGIALVEAAPVAIGALQTAGAASTTSVGLAGGGSGASVLTLGGGSTGGATLGSISGFGGLAWSEIAAGTRLINAAAIAANEATAAASAVTTEKAEEKTNDIYIYKSGNSSDRTFTPRPDKDDGTGIRSGLSFWVTPQQAALSDPKVTIQKVNATQLIALGFQVNFDTDGHVGVRRYSQQELEDWAKSRPGLDIGLPPHTFTVLVKSAIVDSKKIKQYGN